MKTTEQFMEELQAREADEIAAEQWKEEQDLPGGFTALSFFEKGLSKTEIKFMASKAIESVLEKGNPLQVAESLSAMECFIKEVKDTKEFKDYVREEATKTPKGFVSKSGAKIECFEAGTTYDFSKCGDQILIDLEERAQCFKEDVQSRKDFLKTIPLAGVDLVTSDGEVIKIYPPAKSSISSYKVSLAK